LPHGRLAKRSSRYGLPDRLVIVYPLGLAQEVTVVGEQEVGVPCMCRQRSMLTTGRSHEWYQSHTCSPDSQRGRYEDQVHNRIIRRVSFSLS